MLGHLRRERRGDTIVEVLIAMAVIALILGGAYATASRSLAVGQRAKERVEALKLVEGQIEQLKYLAADSTTYGDPNKDVFDNNPARRTFCLENSTKVIITDFANYQTYPDPQCKRQNLYSVGIQYDSAQNDLFTVQAKWDRLGSAGTDEVVVRYRVHK